MIYKIRLLIFFVCLLGLPLIADTASAEQKKVWVAHQNLPPLEEPVPDKPEQVAPEREPFEFLSKQYRVLKEKQVNDKQTYVLLGDEAGNQPIGWVKKEFVVGNQSTMESDNVPQRAMIKPSEDVLEQEAAGNPVEKASPVLAAPIAGAEVIKTFPWGSYHFVYGRSGDYVLIGSAASFD